MILEDFKTLAVQNPEFKILQDFKILTFQNPELNILEEWKIFVTTRFWFSKLLN